MIFIYVPPKRLGVPQEIYCREFLEHLIEVGDLETQMGVAVVAGNPPDAVAQ